MSAPAALGRRWPFLLIGLAVGVLGYGVMELFRLRFARGDVYPPYSSLRADPLGTRVLAEGLAAAGVEVSRHTRRLDRGKLAPVTWYVIGMSKYGIAGVTDEDWSALLDAIARGGRLVVAFDATTSWGEEFVESLDKERRRRRGADDAKNRKPTVRDDAGHDPGDDPFSDDEPEPPGVDADADQPRGAALSVHLGFRLVRDGLQPRPDLRAVRQAEAWPALPAELAWHSRITFETDEAPWTTVYAVDDQPVVLTRDFGRGTIVLAADSFLLSNEAMLQERATSWLVWLQGRHRSAVFDENHLGVIERQGVVTLARRYGLAPTAFVLTLLALLFIWKSNSSLIPAGATAAGRSAEDAGRAALGRESAAGFINLLRRTLDRRQLFAESLAEYRRSGAWRRLAPPAQRGLEALAARPEAATDPIHATREAHALLARKP